VNIVKVSEEDNKLIAIFKNPLYFRGFFVLYQLINIYNQNVLLFQMNHYKILVEFLNFLNGMISEKELVLSHSLIQLLEKIDDPLAKFLLDAHQGKDDLGDSYLDILRDKNDFVSYIGKTLPSEGETEWTSKKRQSTKIGRLLRALLLKKGVDVNDKAIEDFVNKFKIAHNKMFSDSEKTKFELFHGDVISKWYNENKYYIRPDGKTDSISLYNSCMRYESCEDYFTVYTKTPNVYLLALIDIKSNTLMARAIIWKDIKDFEGETYTFMDRVYSIDDETLHMMVDYAKTKGWVYKTEQSYTCQRFNTSDGVKQLNFDINLPKGIDWIEVEKPYMDTIKFLCEDADGYYLTNSSTRSHVQKWSETDGGPNNKCERCGGDGTITCECDNGSYECDECDGDGYQDCPYCDGTEKIECSDCSGTGEIDCEKCDGTGRGSECDTCNGVGETYDECVDCKGKGVILIDEPQLTINGIGEQKKIEVKCKTCKGIGKLNIEKCEDCDGIGYEPCAYCTDGHNTCHNCEGIGKIDCTNSDCNDGKVYCNYCNEGSRECYECGGQGERDCPVCN